MATVIMYTTQWCGFCARAERLLADKGVAFEKIDLDADPSFRAKLLELTGAWTVPQIVIDGRAVGGYAELRDLDRSGSLDALLAA